MNNSNTIVKFRRTVTVYHCSNRMVIKETGEEVVERRIEAASRYIVWRSKLCARLSKVLICLK